MESKIRVCATILLAFLCVPILHCHEKTLRKIVRSQSKMVQRPFSGPSGSDIAWRNTSQTQQYAVKDNQIFFPGFLEMKSSHILQGPKVSKVLSALEPSKSKSTYSRTKLSKNDNLPNDLRLARNTIFPNNTPKIDSYAVLPYADNKYRDQKAININNINVEPTYENDIHPLSKFFPPVGDQELQNVEQNSNSKENIVIPSNIEQLKENSTVQVKSILIPVPTVTVKPVSEAIQQNNHNLQWDTDQNNEKADYLIEATPGANSEYSYNVSTETFFCNVVKQTNADIDAQEKFSEFDIEPPWLFKKHYWNTIFESRYESLMRNPKWPSLKVILIPRSHVDTIWKKSFEQYHNDTVSKILSNAIKKLQFYNNLTFTWNEVSHLSQWWKTTTAKNRSALCKLVKSGRFEITTGGWIEPDEATTHIFGLVHQIVEGHQWLKYHLNYSPRVAWLTSSVSHSPTMTYILSASYIHQIIFTNLHYSWEQFLAEYQFSDFVWIQNWDYNKYIPTEINDALKKIGHDRFPRHATMTHYLQFNSGGFKACGPNGVICNSEYNFAKSNRNIDISPYNVKEKSEALLEQYSKTGTISSHNVIIAPLGGLYSYEHQPEFDYQYNNYQRIADFVNINSNVYKATIEFGTPKDYFTTIFERQKNYPTLKGDFLNFADISSGIPAYWVGYYTTRPLIKILLRRLESTLRTTEILFSFALSLNSFRDYNLSNIFELLIKSRETVARLLDRNVVSGTITAFALKYVHKQILTTVKNCWYLQEVSASFLSMKPGQGLPYLQKYVYRNGEFISTFKTVSPGDQIYIFNSLSHERTEMVELITRYPNIRIIDHNKKDVTVQINPVWKYNSDNLIMISRGFFKLNFVIVMPPMTLELFKIKETYDASQNSATIYCLYCKVDDVSNDDVIFPFNIQPIQSGDIQLENYKNRLVFDEHTGFLKTVIDKETNREKIISMDYGAFRDYNLSNIFELLIKSRETVARLLDRNVVSGTITAFALKYVHKQILTTVKNCWYLQEVSASFLSMKPGQGLPYLQKYVYRNGEFISTFKTVSPGDQIYIFNSLSHERTEMVELITRYPNIRIIDHNKKDVTVQINPVWKYNSDNLIMISRGFFKLNFVIVMPPMTLELFKIKETYDASQNSATIYCLYCKVDDVSNDDVIFPFNIQPIQSGDIQLENYKNRLVFDEHTGFLKTVIDKETNREKIISMDYGAFRDSNINSGMFLFNTNASKPLHDILRPYRVGIKSKITMIVSGLLMTEMTTIYGRLLQHTVKIFNLLSSPLSHGIYIESNVDYEISPKNRELELFLSIQTDIENGVPPKIFTDNNAFQYTGRILKICRRIESNIYPITSMVFIQDKKSRLTVITDHAQGVTALQEGQVVLLLDRRVLFNDGRGTNEGLADSSATCHRHFILLESLTEPTDDDIRYVHNNVVLPSVSAVYLANSLNYALDMFMVDKNQSNLCFYAFLPLIKTSFPCDVMVLNYRVIINRAVSHKYTPSSALMILHRHSFTCQIDYALYRHCNSDNYFAVDKILRNIKSVYQTNLPGTDDGTPVLNFNLVNFPPMELTTLRVYF